MTQALLIAVRFYEGRYHGSGDWPPAPHRLFQALVAGAARGATLPTGARDALDWLEGLEAPTIAALRGKPGQSYTAYVPNNDVDAELRKKATTNLNQAVAAIRIGKTVRPMLFDSEKPVIYCWFLQEAEREKAEAVRDMANDLYRLGLGIDPAWAVGEIIAADEAEERLSCHGGIVYWPSARGEGAVELQCPQPGLRRSLTVRFDAMRNRFRVGKTNCKQVFVQPPKPLVVKVAYNAPPHRLVFELRESDAKADFIPWPLHEVTRLVQEVRDKAAEHLRRAVPDLSDNVDRYLIGRGAADADKAARVRIVPIPSIGHEHADLKIRRLAVYAPQTCPLSKEDLSWAFGQVVWLNGDGVILKELQQVKHDDPMAARFEQRGRCWRSLTPLALPAARHQRMASTRIAEEASAARAVRQALRHAGICTPVAEVRVQREPFNRRGARAEAFASGVRFSKAALWHAAITFEEPVNGPLLLGNGRFLGLGMMHLDQPRSDVLVFSIEEGLASDAKPASVVNAARRAMMARVQQCLEPRVKLPTYVSGHEGNGAPAGDGTHRHIAIAADLSRQRILYIAPTLLERRSAGWGGIQANHDLMARALEGMDILRAGAAGRLMLTSTFLDPESDPLFAPSLAWESVTDYDVTRHRRRLSDEDALKADVVAELNRCGWPRAALDAIEVLAVQRGPRGKLSGRLRLNFTTPQSGPLLIGRTAHKGGGLFSQR